MARQRGALLSCNHAVRELAGIPDFVFLWFPVAEFLRQALLKCVYGVNERVHAIGLKCDHSPFNIRAEISYHLVEPAHAFGSQECHHGFGVLLGVFRVDELAYAPGRQANIIHGMAKAIQDHGVRRGL